MASYLTGLVHLVPQFVNKGSSECNQNVQQEEKVDDVVSDLKGEAVERWGLKGDLVRNGKAVDDGQQHHEHVPFALEAIVRFEDESLHLSTFHQQRLLLLDGQFGLDGLELPLNLHVIIPFRVLFRDQEVPHQVDVLRNVELAEDVGRLVLCDVLVSTLRTDVVENALHAHQHFHLSLVL